MGQSICSIAECGRRVNAKGLCHGHYYRMTHFGDPMPDRPLATKARHLTEICTFDGCGRPTHAVDLCRTHRRQLLREGRPRRIIMTIGLEERFFRYVSEDQGCWRWTGVLDPTGYGVHVVQRRTRRAHRWSYEFLRAEIPEGLHLDHLCRNRWCVNPWHLEPVTAGVNHARGHLARRGVYDLYPEQCRPESLGSEAS